MAQMTGELIIIGGMFPSLWSTFGGEKKKGGQNGWFIEPVSMVTSSLQWGWGSILAELLHTCCLSDKERCMAASCGDATSYEMFVGGLEAAFLFNGSLPSWKKLRHLMFILKTIL